MLTKRCIIYPKDIMMITGRSERYAQAMIHKIREFHGKEIHQFITVREFAEFSGITEEQIQKYMY
ncbi:hypothetical protein [Algoriphagus pacificus]|uniref:Uncharacterized protein n=1 Tax=Algoriphagus pacificus TaxID=2811234 RepID=A0ABS3CAQ8_9BACT|nr:hypothetical protein [Algoriphagus pacificus]MBN7814193.1 hypothetical protein [Algoriphagus pacificus]